MVDFPGKLDLCGDRLLAYLFSDLASWSGLPQPHRYYLVPVPMACLKEHTGYWCNQLNSDRWWAHTNNFVLFQKQLGCHIGKIESKYFQYRNESTGITGIDGYPNVQISSWPRIAMIPNGVSANDYSGFDNLSINYLLKDLVDIRSQFSYSVHDYKSVSDI